MSFGSIRISVHFRFRKLIRSHGKFLERSWTNVD